MEFRAEYLHMGIYRTGFNVWESLFTKLRLEFSDKNEIMNY